jgi:N-hydroxyarylamine O-acetyltransferase
MIDAGCKIKQLLKHKNLKLKFELKLLKVMTDNKALFKKYLALLGIDASSPSLELLKKIVKAHLIKVPFENISKLIYKQRGMNYIPNLSQYIDGIVKYNFGGTCYSNNYYLYLLLEYLGFDIKLCGADMKNPDVHLISVVRINGGEFIIDGGYAAPFLEPLPRDLKEDYIIASGNEKYILKPKNNDGTSLLEQYYKGELKHWYTVKPFPRKIEEFQKVIKESYADNAMFMNALLITHFFENGAVVLRNLNLTETFDGDTTAVKILFEDIPGIAHEKFGMPVDLVKKAVSRLGMLKDTWA